MLSHADQYVKDSIQQYFTIFQSRWQVLCHALLTNGNGMHWNDKGELVSDFDSKEESDLTYFRDICVKDENDILLGRDNEKSAAYRFHQMMIDFYENNIDTIATTFSTLYFEPFMPQMTYSSIKEFVRSPEYSCIFSAVKLKEKHPEWMLDESWEKAVSQVIGKASEILYTEHFKYMDDGSVANKENWTDAQAYECYHKLIEWKQILCPANTEALELIIESLKNMGE